jgi:hypothetical protein
MLYVLFLLGVFGLSYLLFPSDGYVMPEARSLWGSATITLIVGAITWSMF